MSAPLRKDAKAVVGTFLASGTVHLVKPEVYEPLMPSWMPNHREVIVASGVAELVCAVGLLFPPTRRVAGYASAALLSAVYVGNVKMAVDSAQGRSKVPKAAAYARLPMQFPLIWGAWKTARATGS